VSIEPTSSQVAGQDDGFHAREPSTSRVPPGREREDLWTSRETDDICRLRKTPATTPPLSGQHSGSGRSVRSGSVHPL
jgi:hypothetical protein